METMRAVRIHEYGESEVLRYETAPVPATQPDDVLVEVHAAGVNPVDWKVRRGMLKERVRYELPMIPGWDVSGRVVRAGPHVTRFKAGDEVYGRPDLARDGSYAEYVAVRQTELAIKPATLDYVEAAAVPLAALTAWQALFAAHPPYQSARLLPGQRILIHGAAGGVGSFAVQLARWRGAHVIGTGSAESEPFLLGLGVQQFVDYQRDDLARSVGTVDVVLDTVGARTQDESWSLVAQGGTLVSIVRAPSAQRAEETGTHAAYVFVQPDPEQLTQIRQLIDGGVIRPVVSEVLPLAEARRAHEHSEGGHTHGKIVLDVAA